MRIIKQVAGDMKCNIREAEEKIDTAYRLKDSFPAEATWYRDMANAHLGFNAKAHELVKGEIEKYRASDRYKANPEYADGMMDVWNDMHTEIVADFARVKSMIDAWK